MQAAADPFLGWTSGLRVDGAAAKQYYVRQLRDMKGAMNVPVMDPAQLTYYAGLCGWALARAHAQTGQAPMISGYLGSSDRFDRAVEEFAVGWPADAARVAGGCSARWKGAAARHPGAVTAPGRAAHQGEARPAGARAPAAQATGGYAPARQARGGGPVVRPPRPDQMARTA